MALRRSGHRLNDHLERNKAFRNPRIYAKLVEFIELDEIGSNFDKSEFDPHGFPPDATIDGILEAQRKFAEEKAAQQQNRSNIAFVNSSTHTQTGSSGALASVPHNAEQILAAAMANAAKVATYPVNRLVVSGIWRGPSSYHEYGLTSKLRVHRVKELLISLLLLTKRTTIFRSGVATANTSSQFAGGICARQSSTALHDYLPINAPADDSVSCLFFRKGAIIEVFNRDSSGWWDGVSNGVRGWFPSNYVGRIGEATRDSADFEDDVSQRQWEAWRDAVHEEIVASAVAAVGQADADENLSLEQQQQQQQSLPPPPPPPPPKEQHYQQDAPPNRVQLARALLNQGRRSESADGSHCEEGGEEDGSEGRELVVQPRWEVLMVDVAKQISELVAMVDSTKTDHATDDVPIHIFHIVSSIRAVLTAANAVNNDAPLLKTYPDLGRQRKIILSTLSKLVLKGKLSTQPNTKVTSAIGGLANQLLSELGVFEEHLRNVPELTTSTTITTLSSYGTAIGSSSPRSSIDGDNNIDLDVEADAAPGTDAVAASTPVVRKDGVIDPKPILQALLAHQAIINDLVSILAATIEKYLEHRQRASELLETTRKTIEAIRTFLTVIESVCSAVSDIDYHPSSLESTLVPENPHLVALVLVKETVYSAITDLVTCVRTIAGSNHLECALDGKRSLETGTEAVQDLRRCCENVVKATNICTARVRACLGVPTSAIDYDVDNLLVLPHMSPSLSDDQQEQEQQQQQHEEQDVESLAIMQQQKHDSAQTHSTATSDSSSSLWRTSTDSTCTSMATPETTSPVHEQPPLPPLPPPKNQPDQHRRTLVTKTSEPYSLRVSAKQEQSAPSVRHATSLASMNGIDRSDHGKRVFSEDEMIFNSEGQVMGATVEALVEKLTQHEKSPAFLDMLIKRFDLRPPMDDLSEEDLSLWTNRVLLPVRLRVYNVIKIWLETFFCYETDGGIEQTLIEFVMGPMNKVMASPAKRMIELVRKRFTAKHQSGTIRKLSYSNDAAAAFAARPTMLLNSSTKNSNSNSTSTNIFSTLALFEDHSTSSSASASSSSLELGTMAAAAPAPSITRSLRNTLRRAMAQGVLSSVPINEFDPVELARQLTLMESHLFCQIEAKEMIGQEFKKKVGTSMAIHVKAMIQRSTQITSWVADTILRESDVKKRAQMIKLWIKVGDNCLQLRNYNTLMAIRSALDSTSIARLKRTWETVSTKYKAMYDPIYRATDSQRNFAEYRRRLRDAVAPCLPFLGVYLTDMTFIDDGNANYRTSPIMGVQLINFDKYIKTTRILNEIDQFQIPYRLVEVEEIQRYLLQCLETVEKSDQVFYTRSLQLEPREEDFDIRSFISNLA
ncbi:hypothetical protein BX666DRAFT_1876822 [Dichotomocladium elegans]|nr:hypothetical protein BX666DRAFT_1876822 [Dichotomocladium elegans]